jgi:hypothetical protein
MRKFFLMNGLGDLGDAGGGDGGQGAGAAGGDGGAGTGGAAGGDGADFVGPEWAKALNLTLEKEILQDPALGPITDVNSLVKSYVHAQRKIGQKGVLIPSENSPKEEWDTFWQKVGVPLEEAKYAESLKVDKEALGEDMAKEYTKLAHELRIPPSQAKKVADFYATKAKENAQKFAQQSEAQMLEELTALRTKMGDDQYGVNLKKTNDFLKEYAGDEFLTFLRDSGLGKNAKVVEGFMKIASTLGKEPEIPAAGGGAPGGIDYQGEINRLYGNLDDPYFKPNHPDHKRRVSEVNSWYTKLELKK